MVRATGRAKGKIMRESDAFVCVTCVYVEITCRETKRVHGMNESAFKK